MNANDAIRNMVESTGNNMKTISGELGMGKNYIGDFLRRGTTPKVDTFAKIADVCGYDLVLLPRDDAATFIVIDPPTD